MEKTIAVIDIGKSTIGLRIYSARNLRLREEVVTTSREIKKEGILSDDIDSALIFLRRALKKIRGPSRIGVIVPVTMGATIVLVGKDGKTLLPVVSYQHNLGTDTHRRFSRFSGGEERLYRATATPNVPNGLIVVRQIFWLKTKKSETFSRASRILFLPQYIAAQFSGSEKKLVEFSSLGSHTGLYDFRRRTWSYLAKKMKVVGTLFPSRISYPWNVAGRLQTETALKTGLNPECLVLLGGHDTTLSNVPYLLREKRCVVFSTGSWHIATHLGAEFSLPSDGLKKDILAYSDIEGRPALAARSPLGFEFRHYREKIESRFPRAKGGGRPNIGLLKKIIGDAKCFVIPALMRGSGQFPQSLPRIAGEELFYQNADFAYHVLELSLAIQASITIRQVMGRESRSTIYLTGGAAQDNLFTGILATLFPRHKLKVSEIKEGTSLGAAILGKAALEGKHPLKTKAALIDYHDRLVRKLPLSGGEIKRYLSKFIELASK